jgi:hypothetical protein
LTAESCTPAARSTGAAAASAGDAGVVSNSLMASPAGCSLRTDGCCFSWTVDAAFTLAACIGAADDGIVRFAWVGAAVRITADSTDRVIAGVVSEESTEGPPTSAKTAPAAAVAPTAPATRTMLAVRLKSRAGAR